MPLNIHVFVATNKGLVAIQSITDLQDPTLQSVITVNGSTDLATISPAYHRFVQKSTGLIQSEFGGDSFRANISRNIDQGNSWQLPFYLAHLIQAKARQTCNEASIIQLGHGAAQAGDLVFIATGQINTSSGVVEAVQQVPEKCITASAQIKLWMKKGILVEFFVPANSENSLFREEEQDSAGAPINRKSSKQKASLLPDVDCAIYPVIDVTQLKEHVEGLLPICNEPQTKGGNQQISSPIRKSDQVLAHHIQSHDDLLEKKTHVSHGETIHAIGGKSTTLGTLRRKNVVIGFTVIFVTAILTYLLLITQPSIQASGEGTRFIASTKTGQNCDANAAKQVTTIAKQYVTRIAALDLGSACKMTLVSNKRIPQVWLVADTKTLIELSAIEIKDELYWDIPIPSQQQTSREYILIITEDYLDLADLAAFKSHLSRLDENQNASVELLASFFSVIDVNPQYLSHKLVVSSD